MSQREKVSAVSEPADDTPRTTETESDARMSSTQSSPPPSYRSIFLDEGWAHQKYLGWSQIEDHPGLRLLRKRRRPFVSNLVLLTRGGEESVPEVVANCRGPFGFGEIVIHDFDTVLSEAPEISGFRLHRAERGERLLNIATFVFDLTSSEEDILQAMSSDYRRKIKKAPSLGVTVEAHERPAPNLVAAFAEEFNAFARSRGLAPIDPKTLERMYAGGDAILFVARKQGETSNYLHLYKTATTAIFMHGVNLSKENDGAGQFLHWSAIRLLKEMGLSWYDLGGVASTDPSDGIHNFKAKFGLPLVQLGVEWTGAGPNVRLARAARGALTRAKTKFAVFFQ